MVRCGHQGTRFKTNRQGQAEVETRGGSWWGHWHTLYTTNGKALVAGRGEAGGRGGMRAARCQGTSEAPPGLGRVRGDQEQLRGSTGALCLAPPHTQGPPLTPAPPGPSLHLLSPQSAGSASVMGGWEQPPILSPQGWKVRGREELQGAPGPSEGLKRTQKSKRKRPKGFYSVSPGEGQAEYKVSTGGVGTERRSCGLSLASWCQCRSSEGVRGSGAPVPGPSSTPACPSSHRSPWAVLRAQSPPEVWVRRGMLGRGKRPAWAARS